MPACAIELVHTYSLVHDDLPAMDNDDLRRGRPTTHITYDEATAILVGDALLTRAFECLSSPQFISAVGADVALRVVACLAKASGLDGMVGGQALDMGGAISGLKDIEEVHRLKTGALLGSSMAMGALVAGASADEVAQAESLGIRAGLAFQIVDDVLDATADAETLGKTAGIDADNEKMNYVRAAGLDAAKSRATELAAEVMAELPAEKEEHGPLRHLIKALVQRDR